MVPCDAPSTANEKPCRFDEDDSEAYDEEEGDEEEDEEDDEDAEAEARR